MLASFLTRESHYNLAYKIDAMLLAEVNKSIIQRQLNDFKLNNKCL